MKHNPTIRLHGGNRTYVPDDEYVDEFHKVIVSLWENALLSGFKPVTKGAAQMHMMSESAMIIMDDGNPVGRGDAEGPVLTVMVESQIHSIIPVPDSEAPNSGSRVQLWASGAFLISFMRGTSFNVYPPMDDKSKYEKLENGIIVMDEKGMARDPRGAQPYFSKPLRSHSDAVYSAWKFAIDRNQEKFGRITYVEARGCRVPGWTFEGKPWVGRIIVAVSGDTDYVRKR